MNGKTKCSQEWHKNYVKPYCTFRKPFVYYDFSDDNLGY